jgi:hypothetical protein
MKKNGTLMMLNLDASIGLASTFSFPTRTFPFDSTPNWSIIGATAPQDGHQGAQAHISTGRGDFTTFSSKLASVIIIGWGTNSSSVFSCELHLPHLAPDLSLLCGILFLAPHCAHRILKASSGRMLFSSVGSSVWHLPHLAATPIRFSGIRLVAPQLAQPMIYILGLFIQFLTAFSI